MVPLLRSRPGMLVEGGEDVSLGCRPRSKHGHGTGHDAVRLMGGWLLRAREKGAASNSNVCFATLALPHIRQCHCGGCEEF